MHACGATDAEGDARFIGRTAHQTAECIHFADQCALSARTNQNSGGNERSARGWMTALKNGRFR
jgi:hypothetical protein